MDEKRVFRGISWRCMCFVSVALNIGLLFSGFSYERDGLRFGLGEHSKFLKEKTGEANSGSVSSAEPHVSQSCSHSTRVMRRQDSERTIASSSSSSEDSVINLDHGDPTMFESFWRMMGDKSSILISGWQTMSYFSDIGNLCWFLEPEFAKEIKRIHKLVGNANTEDRHIVVGTGSTQLLQAVLYALSPSNTTDPVSVVSAVPYYSSYPLQTDFLRSGLYRWAGDASTFNQEGPYIELVCSPNNPDGYTMEAVVNRPGGIVVHDLAYYWPQYTPITSVADHDLMLFTVSKSTGHAGTRIGWALVKDKDVARKMTKFIELNTIGVSKDSQLRAAKILRTVSDSCEDDSPAAKCLFNFGHRLMENRWKLLREAAWRSGMFSLPEFSSNYCKHSREVTEPHPGFAWLKCEGEIQDCESFLRSHRIITRGGKHFGGDPRYVRVSMLDRDHTFDLFVERLSSIRS